MQTQTNTQCDEEMYSFKKKETPPKPSVNAAAYMTWI